MYKEILLPINMDDTELTGRAIETAEELSERYGAKSHRVYGNTRFRQFHGCELFSGRCPGEGAQSDLRRAAASSSTHVSGNLPRCIVR